MLLTEMVRQISEEENLIDDATEYTRSGASWATLHSYGNITIPTGLIAWACRFNIPSGTAYWRIKVGSHYIYGAKLDSTWLELSGIAWVGEGTHEVLVESYGAAVHKVLNFKFGKAKFTDTFGETLGVYSSTITKQVSNRNIPVGPLNESVFAVWCWAYTPGGQTNFENIGDSLTNGVSLEVDGALVDWDYRQQDVDSVESAAAYHYAELSVGSDHTFEIIKDNANTVVHICIIACPWILSSDTHKPVTLDFPQGSTLYLVMEPLSENPTKYVKIGKKRSVSFGDSTNFYSTAEGADIKSHNYTFENIDEGEIEFTVKGWGGCISIIGVDIK